jgi:hypothetical protein
LLVVVGLGSFWLGRLSVVENIGKTDPPSVYAPHIGDEMPEAPRVPAASSTASSTQFESTGTQNAALVSDATKRYVASKTGTKYHLPWCSGARRIKEENKVWFATKEEAEAAGYTPASNCKGL